METKHRVLIAAQPEGWRILAGALNDVAELFPAHTIVDAFRVLETQAIDLIVCTIAFDDSRMVDFLQTVKRGISVGRIPFLCVRVIRGVVSDELVSSMRTSCAQCGALDLIDVAKLPPPRARAVLRAAVNASLSTYKPNWHQPHVQRAC